MDSFDRMLQPLGTVPARHGANTVVSPSDYGTVLVVHFVQAGQQAIERSHTGAEARDLADLLDQAAVFINGPGTDSDDRHDFGAVITDGTDAYGPTEVRALWPLVEMDARLANGMIHLGLEYTPSNAAELARLLRVAADLLEDA